MLRIAILHNDDRRLASGDARDALAVRAVEEAVAGVHASCEANGWTVVRVPVASRDPRPILDALGAARPDVVFQLCESVEGDARLEAAVAGLLELARLPYTGSPPLAIALGLDKPLAKAVLSARGVPTPHGAIVERGDEPLDALRPPLIVKPSREDASHGIGRESVVADAAAARLRAIEVVRRYAQPALVEEFVDGRELNVTVLGEGDTAEALPPAEIDFARLPPGQPRIVTYEAKWAEGSPDDVGTRPVAARDLAPDVAARVADVAVRAYRALGLRDYGRVDMRLDAEGRPIVLEVNPNPDLSPGAGVAATAARAGFSHAELIRRIVAGALGRGRHVA